MNQSNLHEKAVKFMGALRRHKEDRGALASLRGAVSEKRRPRAWPFLRAFPEAIGNPVYEISAALWAGAPELDDKNAGNLGATLRLLAGGMTTFETRLKRLFSCDQAEAAVRVAPIVRAAQAKGVAVDYTLLLSDLLWWGDRVKVEWAKAFWKTEEREPADEEAAQ